MADLNWMRRQAGRVRRRLAAHPPESSAPAEPAPRSRDAAHLDAHPWFDEQWYRGVAGVKGDRRALVDHYLSTPVEDRLSPHPLFDPVWFADHFNGELDGRDPFLLFTRRKRFRTPFHPLFTLGRYRHLAADCTEHPGGPLGHYLEHGGTAESVGPNGWWPAEEKPLHLWLAERTVEHRRRQQASLGPNPSMRKVIAAGKTPAPTPTGQRVDVVLTPGAVEAELRRSLESLLAQTETGWHVWTEIGRGWGFDVAAVLNDVIGADRWSGVDVRSISGEAPRPSLDPLVVDAGESPWITFLDASDVWEPGRLARLLTAVHERRVDVLADVMARTTLTGLKRHARVGLVAGEPTRSVRLARARLVMSRAAWAERARPALRTDLPSGHEFAMNRALAFPAGIDVLPAVGVHRNEAAREEIRRVPQPLRPVFDHGSVRAWDDVVLRDRLIDLDAERERPREEDVVSVIVPTYADTHLTLRAVESVMEATADSALRVQVIVVDNGCRPEQAAVLDALALRWNTPQAWAEVIHVDANLGFALGNDLAIPALRGTRTVFLNNDTDVMAGWLEPLVEALGAPDVLGAQSLLRYPDGSVQCAGIAFTATGNVPHGFGQWHPVEDVAGVGALRFHALTAACLMMRTADVVALGGFDPVYNNGMEDIDLCLRAGEVLPAPDTTTGPAQGTARFVVAPDSQVWHHESVSPGRFRRYATNRRVFLDRWHGRMPADDVALWSAIGFDVLGHVMDPASGRDRTVTVSRPVVRRPRAHVNESAPRLRWALKNPAPAGELGDKWGDTHFADSLAAALREAGQEVVIDRRDAWERRSSSVDDVSLVLRGLTIHHPSPDQVNLAWVISHPDVVTGAEASAFDRVFAASTTWAARQSERWGFEVESMLQATDRTRFHPDLAAPDTGHPVLFVGSSRRQQRPLVRDAVEANLLLSVYGTEWQGLIPNRFVKAQYLENRLVGAAYRSAGVVLNDHWEDMRTDGFLSNRLFDAAASGARVITDDVAGLGTIFGRSVQVARSAEDLVRLSTLSDPDAVFGDDAERREVAARIHAEHSFTARAERLVEVAAQIHRARGFDRFR